MATWVKLKDKKGGKPVLLINTHFDHVGKEARVASAKLIREKVAELGKGCSVVVTGDFNCGEGSNPYKALFDPAEKKESPLLDSFRVANPKRGEAEGTFTAFEAGPNKGPRIDWVGVSRDWKVVSAGIDRTEKGGRTPSDHFPVTAVLRR